MELALICAQQVIVLFLLIGAGAAAIKTGVLKPEGGRPSRTCWSIWSFRP